MDIYRYRAVVDSVYDGDTLSATIDLGFKLNMNIRLRLAGVNTPEIRGVSKEEKQKGFEARDFVRDLCLDKEVYIQTLKKGKYGRYVAKIWSIEDGTISEKSVNELLIEKELAVGYME